MNLQEIVKTFPNGWLMTAITADCDSLEFFGKDNIGAMIKDWEDFDLFMGRALKACSKKDYRGTLQSFYRRESKKLKYALPILKGALEAAEPKPLLLTHRPDDFFALGETIYAYVVDSDFPELKSKGYKKAKVVSTEKGHIVARIEINGYTYDIGAKVRSESFMKIEELEALKRDDAYRAFWIVNVTENPEYIREIDGAIMATRIRRNPR